MSDYMPKIKVITQIFLQIKLSYHLISLWASPGGPDLTICKNSTLKPQLVSETLRCFWVVTVK